jgi:very-short-patch-repair endonuclease
MAAPVTRRARALRRRPTDAEQKLWQRLRHDQLGVRFRRQHPIGPYVVDFVCLPARLVIEVDGGQHADRVNRDTVRDAWLQEKGFVVLRFWNPQVLSELDAVVDRIDAHISARTGSRSDDLMER